MGLRIPHLLEILSKYVAFPVGNAPYFGYIIIAENEELVKSLEKCYDLPR
jgi:hypothetical protein